MDDTPEPDSDPLDNDGGERSRPSRSRRRSMPGDPTAASSAKSSAKATSSAEQSSGADGARRPRRWWEQPWLWVGVIVVVVVLAVGISLLVNSDPDDITPTADTTAFCAAIAKYRDERDANEANPAPVTDFGPLRGSLVAVQDASPSEIRPTTDEVLLALDQVIKVQQDDQTQGTVLDATAAASAKLSAVNTNFQHASLRFANYTRRACGIDLDAQPVPTTVAPAPGETTVGTPVPSDQGTLVTPN